MHAAIALRLFIDTYCINGKSYKMKNVIQKSQNEEINQIIFSAIQQKMNFDKLNEQPNEIGKKIENHRNLFLYFIVPTLQRIFCLVEDTNISPINSHIIGIVLLIIKEAKNNIIPYLSMILNPLLYLWFFFFFYFILFFYFYYLFIFIFIYLLLLLFLFIYFYFFIFIYLLLFFFFLRQKPKQETLLKQSILVCLKKLIIKIDNNNSLQFSLSILTFLQITKANDPLFDDSVILFKTLLHKINFANEKNSFISNKIEFLNFLKNWIITYLTIVILFFIFIFYFYFILFLFYLFLLFFFIFKKKGSKRRN